MPPPVSTAPAPISTNQMTNSTGGITGGSFSSFIDDLDQFILKDTNNNDLVFNNFNSCDENNFKSFLSTSPSNSCSSILNNNLLNSNEFDLFKFDKLNSTFSSNEMFDICQYNDSLMPYNSVNNMLNLNQNGARIQNDDNEIESDEDQSMRHNLFLQDQELGSENFEFTSNYDNDHMINDIGMISVPDSSANNDTLVAIRDLKRKESRKHKNSTSSVSSVTNTIKKVAIELQNSTANLASSSSIANTFPESTVPGQTTNMNTNQNIELNEFKTNFVDDFDDDNNFDGLLGLDDWEQMLDEDCISRLTTDFSNNFTSNDKSIPSINTINTLNNQSKVPITTVQNTSKGVNQSSRLVPHVSTFSNQTNKNNQPLVLVLSSSNSSSQSSSPSYASPNSVNNSKLKTTSSPSLTPIASASPINSHIKKISTTTIAPTKIISTSKTSPTANVVKKLNSVIISDGCRNPVEKSNNVSNKNSSTIKLENNNINENRNIILKNKSNTLSSPSITSTTNKTITRQVPLTLLTQTLGQTGIKSYRVNGLNNQNSSLSLGSTNNSSMCSSASSSPNLSPASSASPSSSIDQCEIIDCVNPNQIFPYRLPLMRFIKTEMDSNKVDENDWNRNQYYSTQNYEEDEEEEEIDVVSVHNSNNNTSNLNLNHHNYFHTSNSVSSSSYKKQSNKKSSKNNNNSGSGTSSLLANYLKSSPYNKNNKNSHSYNIPKSNNSATTMTAGQGSTVTKTLCKNEGSSVGGPMSTATGGRNKQQNSFIKTTKLNNGISSSGNVAGSSGNKYNEVKTSSACLGTESSKSSNVTKNSNGNRKSNTSAIKKNSLMNKQASTTNTINNSNITQLNSIRILTTTTPTNSSVNNIRQINTSIAKAPQPSSIKLSNTSTPLVLNKEASAPITTTTKYITMTPSKLQGTNIKCQAITPTISSNKPKIVTASNNSLINISSNTLTTTGTSSLNSSLKFSTYNGTSSSNSYITTLKLPANLSKINKKVPTKSKSDEFTSAKASNGGNSAMLTEDEEFYYEDEEFGKSIGSVIEKSKPINQFVKNEINLNLATENNLGLNNSQFSSVKFNDEEIDEFMNGELDDDIDDDDDDIDDDDDECSSSSSASSPSPFASGNSSGYSTPTKSSKLKTEFDKNSSSNFDISNLNEKLSKKPKKMNSSSLSFNSANLNSNPSSKRNSRLSSMGYSSDNPAEKRAFHILSERQRRNDLKKLFETLRTNIPTLCDKQKASKLTILKAAVDHLSEVSNKKEKLSTIYEKEKARHTQLMQHLKNLQQNQQPQQQQQHVNFNYQNVQTTGQPVLAVH